MKQLLGIFLLTAALFSCEQDSVNNELVGTWKWVESTGGIAGVTLKPDSGVVRILSFKENGDFSVSENGQNLVQTTYTITSDTSIYNHEKVPMIKFKDEGQLTRSFSIKADTLFLSDEVYDGFTSKYLAFSTTGL